jgi:hypothetical protein
MFAGNYLMTQFFFDIASQETVYHDFQGRNFTKAEEAYELANLIALDLAITEEAEKAWAKEVHVRNVAGQRLYFVRVSDSDLIAA